MTTPTTPLVAGDDWEFRFTLLDSDGLPFDLTGAPQTLWTMLDRSNHRVIQPDEVSITITDATHGQLSVQIGSNISTRLASSTYSHALRIISGGITSTPFLGILNVLADPWAGVSQQQRDSITRPTVVMEFRAKRRA